MAIKYALVPMKNHETGETRAYATAVRQKYLFEQLVQQATDETTVTAADCKAVIAAVMKIVKREVLAGNEVVLGELGTLYTTLSSEGATDVEKFSTSQIKAVRVRFRPSTELKKEVAKATFELTSTKKLSREAVKQMKAEVQEAIAGGDDDDDSGDGGDGGQP